MQKYARKFVFQKDFSSNLSPKEHVSSFPHLQLFSTFRYLPQRALMEREDHRWFVPTYSNATSPTLSTEATTSTEASSPDSNAMSKNSKDSTSSENSRASPFLNGSPNSFSSNFRGYESPALYEETNNLFNFYCLKRVFRQIVDGVLYMHSKKVIHKDLKPQNMGCTELFTNEHLYSGSSGDGFLGGRQTGKS